MEDPPSVKVDPRRALPSVERLVRESRDLRPDLPRWALAAGARRTLESAREALAGSPDAAPSADVLRERACRAAQALAEPRPRRVVNATGVLLHTNLGRAPLAPGAAAAAAAAGQGYTDLELEVGSGRRGDRQQAVAEKLCLLSGAEAAGVVNNGAAAVLLAADSLARGREVVVSRGELVEIGGSFRVPEILERAGVRLVEVGTTNRTHLRDYARAIGPATGLLLKVHRSNFAQTGYVSEVALPELVALGREHDVPVVEDLGSATLVDLGHRGLPPEAFAPARVRAGADAVCFSGDKLLGGPQAGIVLGRRQAVRAMRANPLARALRMDKLSLAALDWTLGVLLDGRAETELPVLRQLLEPVERLEARAHALAERIRAVAPAGVRVTVERESSPLGGGSLPGLALESAAVVVETDGGAEALAAALRGAPVPVLARVHEDRVRLDLRTLPPDDEKAVEEAFRLIERVEPIV